MDNYKVGRFLKHNVDVLGCACIISKKILLLYVWFCQQISRIWVTCANVVTKIKRVKDNVLSDDSIRREYT